MGSRSGKRNSKTVMKALFINPPIQDFYTTSVRRQPIGLLTIAAAVRAAGFEAELINAHTGRSRVISMPDEFRYLDRYRRDADPSLAFPFRYYRHFGMSFEEIEARIRRSGADAIFISSLFTPYYRECDAVIRAARRALPGAMIAVGGYHAALYPSYYLEEMEVDAVVTGEGEEAAVGLMRVMRGDADISEVPNLACRKAGRIILTSRRHAPIDSIPIPARDLLSPRSFRAYGRKAASMVASRGCPNQCSFCTSRALWGATYRARSVASILDEIRDCVRRYGITMINFEDDNLFPSRERAEEILSALAAFKERECPSLDVTAMNGISIEQVDGEVLEWMRRAGFCEINISLVSRSSDILARHRRPFDADRVEEAVAQARRRGMKVRAYFILGLPGQTPDEARETIGFLHKIGAQIFPSVYYRPNAPREEWMMQRSSCFFNETEEMSRDEMIRIFNECLALHNAAFSTSSK